MAELEVGIQLSRLEAEDKARLGDPRQSYEATTKVRRGVGC